MYKKAEVNVLEKEKRIPLSPKEKEGLSDEEIFMREYGVYINFVYDSYWLNKFKEIYGCTPKLP